MKASVHDAGFTLLELLIVCAVIGILGSVATPVLIAARESGNEASAIGSMRAVNSAEITYSASCGGGGFATTLAALALPPPGGTAFISPDLTSGAPKSGYQIALAVNGALNGGLVLLPAGSTCNGAATNAVAGYFASAVPVQVGRTGQRSFATDNRSIIFQDDTGLPIANPVPAGTQTIK